METVSVRECVFAMNIRLLERFSYGDSTLFDLLFGRVKPPAQGARFDVNFEGEIEGPNIVGRISGIDYVLVTPEGLIDLTFYGKIITDDDVKVAYRANGSLERDEDRWLLTKTAKLISENEKYTWLNKINFIIKGEFWPEEKRAEYKGYRL